jgi:hypothetical protein
MIPGTICISIEMEKKKRSSLEVVKFPCLCIPEMCGQIVALLSKLDRDDFMHPSEGVF